MFFFDSTYILVLIGAVICMLASSRVNRTFQKYSGVRSASGLTGQEAARKILKANDIYDVQVERVAGNLSDHYDPRNKVLKLSDSTFNSTSVAAIGVAAHECGHALQHNSGYVPLAIRGALVPVANFGSMAAWPLIIIGMFMSSNTAMIFINLGIMLFLAAVLFQLVTLPVEFNASRRAIRILESSRMLSDEEIEITKKVLSAAALTYVASAAAMVLQLLRLLLLSGRRRR